MRLLLALLLVAGCDDGHYPGGSPPPPVGNGGTNGRADGGVAGDGGGPTEGIVSGTVCEVPDVRFPGACLPLQGGVTVTVEETGESVALAIDGTFSLPAPSDGATATLLVDDGDQVYAGGIERVTLSEEQAATNVVVRVVTQAYLQDIATTTQVGGLSDAEGTVIARVLENGQPVEGAVFQPIDAVSTPYYDFEDSVFFSPDPPTGPAGTALFFHVLPGDVTLTVTADTDTRTLTTLASPNRITFTAATI